MKAVAACLIGFFGILIVVAVVIGLYVIGQYNGLVNSSVNVDQGWANVQNVYQRRSDLIPGLVSTVQGVASFEKSTYVGVAEARASAGKLQVDMKNAPATAEELQKFQEAQQGLSSSLSRLMVVVEKYPELKANQNFLELQSQLEGTENRIAVERRNYNGVVAIYNKSVQAFPVVIFSGALGFHKKAEFTATEKAQSAPEVKFDFK